MMMNSKHLLQQLALFLATITLMLMTLMTVTVKATIIEGDLTMTSFCSDSGPFNLTAIGWSETSSDETLSFRFKCAVNDHSEQPISSFISQTHYIYAPNHYLGGVHCTVEVISSNFTEEDEPISVIQSYNSLQLAASMETFQCLFDKFSIIPIDQHPTHIEYIVRSIIEVSTEYLSMQQKETLLSMVLDEFESNNNLKADNVTSCLYMVFDEMSNVDELTLDIFERMAKALTRALNSGDFGQQSNGYEAKYTAEQLCERLISPESTPQQKQVIETLVSALMIRLREQLTVGDEVQFFTSQYKVIAKRVLPDPLESDIVFRLYQADTRQVKKTAKSQNMNNNHITVVVNRQNFDTIQESSIYAQASAIAYPTNSYETKCDSEMVSPSVSVQLLSLSQSEIVLPPVVNSPLFNSIITPSEQLTSTSYNYTCRFFDDTKKTWTSDKKVCQTQIGEIYDDEYPPEVTCSCIQQGQIGVSLDYVQSSSKSESSGSKCDNPCGCKSKKNGWAPWKTALLVLGLLTIVLIIAALIGVFAIVVVLQLRKGGEVQ